MRPLRGAVWICAVVLSALSAAPVDAAWCNVFQVCWQRSPRKSASYYLAPTACCDPCPQTACTTQYVQRCYYQPVTTYQTRSYYEPVTTYQTSYYYEPVTGYRYSNYYDPCSCSYQQVAVPTTSYRLRSQTCPVQSWVQRCATVPVTAYQQAYYWEPVTACTTTTSAYLLPPQTSTPTIPTAPTGPAVSEPRTSTSPGVSDIPTRNTDGMPFNRYYPPIGTTPPASGSSYRQALPAPPTPLQETLPPAPVPKAKLDRIAAVGSGNVQGQVVKDDNAPWSWARVLFINADRREPRQTVTADGEGQFQANLGPGGWLVYVEGAEGKPVFHRKIEVRGNELRQVQLVSR